MEVSRRGTVTEYKKGHTYLTHTEWEDGHCEIEVHQCIPEMVWHSCDRNEIKEAFDVLDRAENPLHPPTIEPPQKRLMR